jgi:hypothetical protein
MNETAILEHRNRFALPDTPPELVSSSASSYSSRSSPATTYAGINNTSLPMSSYDKVGLLNMSSHDKIADPGHSRIEPVARPGGSHQQLPSLSSLFGPPSSVRPLHSPHSDRPGGYPLTSPLDHPRLSGSGPRNSYFPLTTSPSHAQPRSYEKQEQERQSLQPLVRSYSGSSSPRFHEGNSHRSGSRSEAESGGKWPMQHDPSRHEYSLGSREAAYRSPPDHFRLQFPGPREPALGYSDHRSAHGGPNPPPTPASTVNSDGVPSKDGLGPKIWTGTHFLPRFVRAAEVPGEGLCYFYDDGSHCKTVIDGEAVNAHWGVTKAGKPRKRLAIACITCREKKIKCDPDYPRCVQCEKFGRTCRFKNAR